MPRQPITAAQFVNAVHRRLVLLRLLEKIGQGILFASILAIFLLAVAMWQSMPALPILLFCAILGILIGCAMAFYRWPSRLVTATEADRQLRMQDLLTTALFSSTSTNDEFFIAIRAMADAKCQSHFPSEVILRRFGVRSWCAIVLAVGVAVTLAAIPMSSTPSQAIDGNSAVLSAENPLQQGHGPIPITNNPRSDSVSNNSMTVETETDPVASATNSSSGKPKNGTAGGDQTVVQPRPANLIRL